MQKGTAETMLFQGKIPQCHGRLSSCTVFAINYRPRRGDYPFAREFSLFLLLQAMRKSSTRPIGHSQRLCRGRVNI